MIDLSQTSITFGAMHLRVGLCKSSPDAQYYLNGSTLRTVDDVRDLGILFDANMCFKAHINLIDWLSRV